MSRPARIVRQAFLLLLAAVLFAPGRPAHAGRGAWTPLGPDGGSIRALVVAPSNPRILYAGGDSGVFKSADGGASWVSAGRDSGLRSVSSLAVDPQDPKTVYAMMAGYAVFKSTDGGRTWRMSSRDGKPFSQVGGLQLAIDPRQRRVLYAGTRQGVFRSANGGTVWKSRSAGLPAGTAVFGLGVDPGNGTVYAGVQSHGLYRSANQGASWQPSGAGLPEGSTVLAIAFSPGSAALLAGTDVGLYRSTDRGRSWTFAGGPEGVVLALAFQGRRAYAGSYTSGIFRSDDAGATWQPALEGPPPAIIQALAAAPGAVYAGTAEGRPVSGVFRSVDDGETWQPAQDGLMGFPVQAVAVDPTDSRTIFTAAGTSGLFRSLDGGESWTLLDLGLPPGSTFAITAILIDPARPATIYVTTAFNGPFLRSDDGGETWRQLAVPPPPAGFANVDSLTVDPRAAGALWAATGNGLFHSADRGATWQRVDLGSSDYLVLTSVQVSPRDPGVLYVAGAAVSGAQVPQFEARVFRSTDGGRTWQRRDAGLPGLQLAGLVVDPTDSDRLWVRGYQSIYRSTDGGASWTLALEIRQGILSDLAVAPPAASSPTTLYASRQSFGLAPSAVLRSTDGGRTWTELRAGLGLRVPDVLEVDPQDPDRLLLGTQDGGLLTWTSP